MKIALVHDLLFEYAGSERVVKQILSLYPNADLYSLVDFIKPEERGFLQGKTVTTSFLQHFPLARSNPAKILPYTLPIMPLAIEQFDLSGYDLIISSSHSVAKGVLSGPDQVHISYVHSPMRYAWDLQPAYLKANHGALGRGLKGWVTRALLSYLRLWDARTANGVDTFVANSAYVARRIWKTYRREAYVVYPPVDIERFSLQTAKEDFYVVVSRLVPYKRIDLIVEAFNQMPERKIVIIGDGPDRKLLQRRAGPNIQWLGHQPDEVVKSAMGQAAAFIIAAEEDFGISPIEAQACGTPVIAFGRGGAKETIHGLEHEKPTGVFFDRQDPGALIEAIQTFEQVRMDFHPTVCRENAQRFSPERFRSAFRTVVENEYIDIGNRSKNPTPTEKMDSLSIR